MYIITLPYHICSPVYIISQVTCIQTPFQITFSRHRIIFCECWPEYDTKKITLQKYNVINVFTVVVHNKAADVTFENQDPFISSGTVLKLHWSPKSVVPFVSIDSYTVDFVLREYNNTSHEWVFTDLAKDIPNTGYVEVVTPDFVSPENYNDFFTSAIIQIGVSESNFVAQGRKREVFSLRAIAKYTVIIYVVKVVLVDPLFRQLCDEWADTQSREQALQILASLPACPCNESEILKNRETFEKDTGLVNAILRLYFHPGSCSCFRQRTKYG